MVVDMHEELKCAKPSKKGQVESIIILDRNVDPITPLCTPLTYEGLIDQFYGIHNSKIE